MFIRHSYNVKWTPYVCSVKVKCPLWYLFYEYKPSLERQKGLPRNHLSVSIQLFVSFSPIYFHYCQSFEHLKLYFYWTLLSERHVFQPYHKPAAYKILNSNKMSRKSLPRIHSGKEIINCISVQVTTLAFDNTSMPYRAYLFQRVGRFGIRT